MSGPDAAPAAGPPFQPRPARPRVLLLGEAAGCEVVAALALSLAGRTDAPWRPLVLLGAHGGFPFRARPSTVIVPGMPAGVIACLPRLDAASVPSRLASAMDLPGCFGGTVVELAAAWLDALPTRELAAIEVCAAGPSDHLAAAGHLARSRGLPFSRS